MSTLKLADVEVKLFGASDVYYYAVDNRPLRELVKNDQAINTELEDLRNKTREIATWSIESPAQENDVGGIFVSEWGGKVGSIVVSCSQPGSASTFEIDIKADGTSIFNSPAERPLLAFGDSDKVIVSIPPNIVSTIWPAGALFTLDLLQVQTGSPRWLRVDVYITTTLVDSSSWDFD